MKLHSLLSCMKIQFGEVFTELLGCEDFWKESTLVFFPVFRFKCKIIILLIYQLRYILYHFKANSLYFKVNWIIKAKQTSLACIN